MADYSDASWEAEAYYEASMERVRTTHVPRQMSQIEWRGAGRVADSILAEEPSMSLRLQAACTTHEAAHLRAARLRWRRCPQLCAGCRCDRACPWYYDPLPAHQLVQNETPLDAGMRVSVGENAPVVDITIRPNGATTLSLRRSQPVTVNQGVVGSSPTSGALNQALSAQFRKSLSIISRICPKTLSSTHRPSCAWR
jgi:hypothetical protein